MASCKYHPVKNSQKLKDEIDALKSIWSRESIITTRAVVYLCELMERLLVAVEKREARERRPRKPSAWNRAVSAGRKEGKSFKQVAEEYHQQKGQP